jgi:hypothetical protein
MRCKSSPGRVQALQHDSDAVKLVLDMNGYRAWAYSVETLYKTETRTHRGRLFR